MPADESVPPAPAANEPAGPAADDTIDGLRRDVARAVRTICPRWLADQADDLMQLAMMRLMPRLHAADETPVVLTQSYIYRAAYSVLIDEIRKRRRLHEVPIDLDRHIAPQGAGSPEREVTAHFARKAVRHCLGELATARRRAVMLHLQGHTLDQTSALLSYARKQTENLVYRGLGDLRACLRARGVEP